MEEQKSKYHLNDFKIILKYLKNKKWQCIVYIILVILTMLPQIICPMLWGFALETLLTKQFQKFVIIVAIYEGMYILFQSIIYNLRGRVYKSLEVEFITNVTKDLYQKIDKLELGYTSFEVADYHDMDKYYSQEKQEKYGVVGIGIELL